MTSTRPSPSPSAISVTPIADLKDPQANSVAIDLPSGLWIAKLTAADDPGALLGSPGDIPTNWFGSPLATNHTFGGILSMDDVGLGIEPNLSPTRSLPLPGDRIIVARTGRRVEVFGAVVITNLTVTADGAVRMGHRPLIRFSVPVDLRAARRQNALLGSHWDTLFGRSGRDRRLLPLADAAVALSFSAFGFSLESLMADRTATDFMATDAAPVWELGSEIEGVAIASELAANRVADGVAAYHALKEVLGAGPDRPAVVEVSAVRPGRDVLISISENDRTRFVIAAGLPTGQSYRINPAYRDLIEGGAAETILAIEGPEEWTLFQLDTEECMTLHAVEREQHERRN